LGIGLRQEKRASALSQHGESVDMVFGRFLRESSALKAYSQEERFGLYDDQITKTPERQWRGGTLLFPELRNDPLIRRKNAVLRSRIGRRS